MALKPDPNDPNYKEQMEQYKKDPTPWTRPDLRLIANAQPPVRAADYKPAPLKQQEGREHSIERIRRRLLAHHSIRGALGTAERSVHAAEALYAIAGEDEDKVDYDNDAARNMLRSAGLLS